MRTNTQSLDFGPGVILGESVTRGFKVLNEGALDVEWVVEPVAARQEELDADEGELVGEEAAAAARAAQVGATTSVRQASCSWAQAPPAGAQAHKSQAQPAECSRGMCTQTGPTRGANKRCFRSAAASGLARTPCA